MGSVQIKKFLFTSITLSLIVLIYYKYYYFVLEQINLTFDANFEIQKLIVPIGLSFVFFSSISYLVDIYRRECKAGSFIDAALYILFFPKMISGPVVLWKDFSKQLQNLSIESKLFSEGFERFIVGLAKKIIIADTFASCISQIDAQLPEKLTFLTFWGKSILFMFQLYFDFSGYSDMAIGMMKIFGFKDTKENFNFPYCSTSITDFWRRWHISLGNWFREYVYIPLGGNRNGNVYLNLFIVFVLTGIWHGVGLNFLVWGALNGVFIVIERSISKTKFYNAIPKLIKWLFTMVIVFFLWNVFMNKDFEVTKECFKHLFTFKNPEKVNFSFLYYFDNRIIIFLIISMICSFLELVPFVKDKIVSVFSSKIGNFMKYILLILLLLVSLSFVVSSTYHPFIYFRF